MTREQAHKALTGITDAMKDAHPGQPDRLHQMENHAATVHMAIDHLFDATENTQAEG